MLEIWFFLSRHIINCKRVIIRIFYIEEYHYENY